MRELEEKWHKRKCGIQTYTVDRLTNLRFADDLLLVASSRRQAQGMLSDLICGARAYGLEVHEDKTKILWNGFGQDSTTTAAKVQSRTFEVLQVGESTLYLGRLLDLFNIHDTELSKERRRHGQSLQSTEQSSPVKTIH